MAQTQSITGRHRKRHFLRYSSVLLLFLALLWAGRVWSIEGRWKEIRVTGASMAATFPGEHLRVHCPDCEFDCLLDAAANRSARRTCPNCSYVHRPVTTETLVPGQRVEIDRWPAWTRSLRRFDVVAFSDPDQPDVRALKRLVGFPGERMVIRDGDLWINDSIAQKSYEQYRQLAILVHDDRFRPHLAGDEPPRWRPARDDSSWSTNLDGYQFESEPQPDSQAMDGEWDSLEYVHWRGYESPAPRFTPVPIQDNDPYNESISRVLNNVSDIGISARVNGSPRAETAWQLSTGGRQWELRLRFDDIGGELYQDKVLAAKFKSSKLVSGREIPVEFALCDQQVFAVVDGDLVLHHRLARANVSANSTQDPQAATAPFATQVSLSVFRFFDRSITIGVRSIQIWRDIYYLAPASSRENADSADALAETALADDACYVLGDNPPRSRDSREWPPSAVRLSTLHGRVQKKTPTSYRP